MKHILGLFKRPQARPAGEAPAPAETDRPAAAVLDHVLHVSIGPVQGWIAEARRTRDIWAGSFLLSYLSGCAMAAVRAKGGRITTPAHVDDDEFFRAIEGESASTIAIGSLPNHFRAIVPATFNPNLCTQAVQSAWVDIALAVWKHFLPSDLHESVQTIWNRQIGKANDAPPFWDVIWAMGPDPKDRSDLGWIDSLKFTRLPKPAYGASGHMCAMMRGLEELGGALEASARKEFWEDVRTQISSKVYPGQEHTNILELGATERLSAIAFVKRMFPALPGETHKDLLGWAPGREGAARTDPLRVWPSTGHIAAVPWLLRAKSVAETELKAFSEKPPTVLSKAEADCQIAALRGDAWSAVDGRLFYAEAETDFQAPDDPADGGRRTAPDWAKGAMDQLTDLRQKLKDKGLEARPSPYFAIIAADGDQLGAKLRVDNYGKIPPALAAFAKRARALYEDFHGVPLYAGGDDVFGFSPIDTAIPLATALRDAWSREMRDLPAPPTLSAAISFVHMRHVLRWGVSATRDLLDNVAKTEMGRNALALRIQRAGAADTVWAATWDGGRIEALQQLIASKIGDNAFTYGAVRKIPWIWNSDDDFITARRKAEKSGVLNLDDAKLGRLIAAATERPLDLTTKVAKAARVFNNNGAPLSPDLLAILRFMLLHERLCDHGAAR